MNNVGYYVFHIKIVIETLLSFFIYFIFTRRFSYYTKLYNREGDDVK